MIAEASLFILFLMFVLFLKTSRKPPNLPPGSFGLPVFGNIFAATNVQAVRNNIKKMWEEHGDIFVSKMGKFTIVYLANPALVKKAFTMPQFQERPDFRHLKMMRNGSKDYGVLFSGGETWKTNRRFLLQHLRNSGMGKSFLENSMITETGMLADYIEKNYLDKPSDFGRCVNVSILNVIWLMVAGIRYDADDETMQNFVQKWNENVAISQGGPLMTVNYLPWIASILPKSVLDRWTRAPTYCGNMQNFRNFLQGIIDEHKANLDESDPKDIIDQYLLEGRDKTDKDYFNLQILMTDMFLAGSDTTAGTMRWLILHMALYPEVQRKIHAEMDEVVGQQAPTLADKQRLPYFEASIMESMRLASFVPMGLPHRATETVQLEGYTIPKDAIINGCLFLCHHDPRYWEKPDSLHPEHFLDSEGNLSTRNEAFMPFSLGRRQCLGETLARTELYLFASTLLHRFRIEKVPGEDLKAEPLNDQFFLNFPKPYKVIFRKRFPCTS